MSRACLIGLLINFTLQVAANCLTPLWAIYTPMIGGDVRDAGIAIIIFTWGAAIFSILTPIVNSKLKLPIGFLLLLGISIDLLAIVCYFFIDNIYALYITQLLLASGAGIQIPSFYTIYDRSITSTDRSIAWGALDAAFYFAIGIGSLVAAYLMYHGGIYQVFTLMLILGILSFILGCLFIRIDSSRIRRDKMD